MDEPQPASPMSVRATLFATAAWLYLLGVVIQISLVGGALFKVFDWTLHESLGYTLGLLVLLVLVAGIAAHPGRATMGFAVALTISGMAQPELAEAKTVAPLIAAFHPVNALVLCWLSWVVAQRSLAHARSMRGRDEPAPGPSGGLTAPEAGVREPGFPHPRGPRSLEDGTSPPV
jgi:hypothetical protein